MRTLLEALFVRSTPEKFCCSLEEDPHAIAILLGDIIRRNQDWRAEVSCQDLGVVLVNSLEFPVHIWWTSRRYIKGIVRRTVEKELPAWCSIVNPGVKREYFQLWRYLNMLYERLSLPWKLLQYSEDLLWKPILTAVDGLYDDIKTLWNI